MNQNIEKLVACIPTDTSGRWVAISDMEKFAELVIRDCVKMCYETTGNSYLNGVAAGTKIMLHFGVTNEH